jgi:isoleucyl-tRNA synthetase
VAKRVEKHGIEAWQTLDPKDLLGDEAAQYEKNRDTLDVWFDSGTTHWTVIRGSHRDELYDPAADLPMAAGRPLSGRLGPASRLVPLVAADRVDALWPPPYKALLTHGFTVDGEGRKMSKSLGNTVSPQDISNKMGAEIIRLWVASTDYSGELSISDEILKRVVEGYRRIRNTLRFLLANLSDFDHAKHALPASEWLEIDRYAVALTDRLQKEVLSHYQAYEFHPVVAKLQTFCSEDLGGFYLDVLKDRLYTTAADSKARRGAQNALYHITQAMLHWMAPFLSFTAEEAWQIFAHGTEHRTRSSRARTMRSRRWTTATRCCRSGTRSVPCAPKSRASSKPCAWKATSVRRCRRKSRSPRAVRCWPRCRAWKTTCVSCC